MAGAGKPLLRKELTLSGLDQTEYTVTVSFRRKRTFTAAEPTLTDGQGTRFLGTVAITWRGPARLWSGAFCPRARRWPIRSPSGHELQHGQPLGVLYGR